ncbi:MAG TPA: amidohydrolase [Thermoanaerobaculia bacterium]|nr:amidohydrolase [Thermoanaerobaculia bacterium]HQN07098.1 amidohydrolase [Thermoanaerobaculia bacterium]HQP86338.1 amidohydrolase [Thermoanaerobaculia bacterium]
MRPAAAALAAGLAVPALAAPPAPRLQAVLAPLAGETEPLGELYRELHATPELSMQETATAAKMAGRLRALGYEVSEGVGGTGIVGVLRNGDGPVVMLRTDLDALPVEEKTGVSFASRATGKADDGTPTPVMHACGHDLHMTAWTGAATLLARAKGSWRGTLVMVGQPAEEKGAGAAKMLKDGLFSRFPRPDFALALHVTPELPAGSVGVTPGAAFASVDSVDLTIHGKGGHGAMPHRTVDPVLIAARTVVALQALVSREKDPFEPAVVSVGSFQAGAKHNVIPPEARLKITVRAYREEVRQRLLEGIRRVATGESIAGNAPKAPDFSIVESTPGVVNDASLTERLRTAFTAALGAANVASFPPASVSEDFSYFGREGVPASLFWLGVAEPAALAKAKADGTSLPPLHSAEFAPAYAPAIRTAVTALVSGALELLPAR